MTETVHLKLPELAAAQAQKHVTHNEALVLLDALVQLSVISRTLSSPPSAPVQGDRYLIAASPTGDWAGHAGDLAFRQDGVWRFATPQAGWRLWSIAEGKLLAWNGTAWVELIGSGGALQNVPLLGVNTTADATNKLSARANAALFTALEAASGGNGDMQ